MANIISEWLNPNNFAVLRDKINAIVLVLSSGSTGQVYNKYGNGNGESQWSNLFDLMPTGQPWKTYVTDLSSAPFNGKWLAQDGTTLGNMSSTADHIGDTYKNLFLFLWDTFADAQCPVSGGRGSDSLSDYNANKKIALPDTRGRFSVAFDSRTSDPSNGVWDLFYSVIGKHGGEKQHTLLKAEGAIPDLTGETQTIGKQASTDSSHDFDAVAIGAGTPQTLSVSISGFDASNAHNNTPAFYSENSIIKI